MIEIRRATDSDVPTLVALNDTVQKMHAVEYPQIFKYPASAEEIAAFFSERISRENNLWLLAYTQNGEATGYIWATINNMHENPFKFGERVMYIHQISVSPEHRQSGVGRALMQRVERYASDQGIHRLELDSWMFNQEAHDFFHRLGFTNYRVEMCKAI